MKHALTVERAGDVINRVGEGTSTVAGISNKRLAADEPHLEAICYRTAHVMSPLPLIRLSNR